MPTIRDWTAESIVAPASMTMTGDPERIRACSELGYTPVYGDLIYGKSHAAELVGITTARLAKLIQPIEYRKNPHYRSSAEVGLYDPVEILRLRDSPAIKRIAEMTAKQRATRSLAAYRAADSRRANEVESDPRARRELLPLLHTTARYTATYSGPGTHGFLLRNVMHDGQLVTDHVWIHDQLTPEPAVGEQFEFSAWAEWYRKGYMGWREDVDRERGTRCDIQLIDVRRIEQSQAAE